MRLPLSLLALGAVLEGRYEYRLIDGNVDPDPVHTALDALADVLPGGHRAKRHAGTSRSRPPSPQVASALRAARPEFPTIVWGGYFPTLYPASAINAP